MTEKSEMLALADVGSFVENYRFEFDDGRSYAPDDREKAMLEDALMSFISQMLNEANLRTAAANAESVADLRLCGLCHTWNSKPCGEQCGWMPNGPTVADITKEPT